jgi:hypothetical protein
MAIVLAAQPAIDGLKVVMHMDSNGYTGFARTVPGEHGAQGI